VRAENFAQRRYGVGVHSGRLQLVDYHFFTVGGEKRARQTQRRGGYGKSQYLFHFFLL